MNQFCWALMTGNAAARIRAAVLLLVPSWPRGAFCYYGPAQPESRPSEDSVFSSETSSAFEESGAVSSTALSAIPFQLSNGFLTVVNGRIGPLGALRFILDTGGTHCVVDIKGNLNPSACGTRKWQIHGRVHTRAPLALDEVNGERR